MAVSYKSDFTPRYNTLYLIINHLSNWYYTKHPENLWKIILPVKLGLEDLSLRNFALFPRNTFCREGHDSEYLSPMFEMTDIKNFSDLSESPSKEESLEK